MRVAFASTDGQKIDCHFGLATRFYLWNVEVDRAESLGFVAAEETGEDQEDKILARAHALEGCALVYSLQIGGPAAAKLVSRRIHPMKTERERSIEQVIGELTHVLKHQPPPWLRQRVR